MTYGQLFREVVKQLDGGINEGCCRYADSMVPDFINEEIPPERVEQIRAMLIPRAKKYLAMSQEEARKELNKHLEKN